MSTQEPTRCEACERKDAIVVELQHAIRELRHDLAIARLETRIAQDVNAFKRAS